MTLYFLIWLSIFFPFLRHGASHNFQQLVLQTCFSINGNKSLKTLRNFWGRREGLNLRGGQTGKLKKSSAFLTKLYLVKNSKTCSLLCSGMFFCGSCTAQLRKFCDEKHTSNAISRCCFVSEEINQLLRIRLFALMRNSIR